MSILFCESTKCFSQKVKETQVPLGHFLEQRLSTACLAPHTLVSTHTRTLTVHTCTHTHSHEHTCTPSHVHTCVHSLVQRSHAHAHVHTCTHSHLHTRTRAQILHVRLLPCILRNEPGQTSRAAACLPPRGSVRAARPARPPGSARLPWAGSPCSPSAFPSGFRAPAGLLRLLAHRARATPCLLLLSTCLVARVREKEGKIRLEGAHVCAYTPHLLGRLTLTVRGRPRPVRTEEELGRETAAENLAEEGEPRPRRRRDNCIPVALTRNESPGSTCASGAARPPAPSLAGEVEDCDPAPRV